MAEMGRFVSDPGAGAYCQVTLESGEKIVVNHSKGGFKGGFITIAQVKWLGFASGETLFRCDLDSTEGKLLLADLTRNAPPESVQATPLGAFVDCLTDCRSIADVKRRWVVTT